MEARLRPLTVPGEQTCRDYAITVEPSVAVFGYDQPQEMGLVNHFVIRGDPHQFLSIHAESIAETLRDNPFSDLTLLAEDWSLLSSHDLHEQYAEYLAPSPLIPLDGGWLAEGWSGPTPEPSVLQYAQALSNEIYEQFEYVPGSTDTTTPLTEFVAQKRGVCQDYAHLMIAAARAHGVPARYVSGYIYSGEGDATQGVGATHAWAELYLPHISAWRGFDPTNNILVADKHIKVAVGRDYSDVPPTKGIVRAAAGKPLPTATALEVDVQVEILG